MSDHIKIHTTNTKWVVRAGGAILGESDQAMELIEGDYTPVIYFPRSDIAMEFLDVSQHQSHCPHKGDASYFSIQTKSTLLKNVVWSYTNPHQSVARIKDYLAFDPAMVMVEEL